MNRIPILGLGVVWSLMLLSGHVAWAGEKRLPVIAGPDGVAQELENSEQRESIYTLQHLIKPYFDWKKRIKEDYGLSFGLSAHLLYQNASETFGDDDQALGGVYRFQGSWVAFARDTGHPGRLEWRVENRNNIGGYLSPSQLGGESGAVALNPGFGYSHNFETDLSVLNWTQVLFDHRAGFAIGRLAFVVNPTVGTTGIGALGVVTKGFVTDNILIGGQIYDGNAASGDFDIDTFKESEWLKAVEIAWTPSAERYKTDRIQLTYWHKDERQVAGIQSGNGWVVSGSWKVNDRFIPFTRFGHSDGGAGVAVESAVTVGFEYTPIKNQTWSLGAGWAKTSKKNKIEPRDEYVVETSYTFQITPNFSITPDVQLLIDPANYVEENSVWIAGLRCIITL